MSKTKSLHLRTKIDRLFSEETEGGYVKTVDLSDSSISKIQLNVSNAEINIKGNSNHPYIEFLNFRESFYKDNSYIGTFYYNENSDGKIGNFIGCGKI